MIYTLSGGWPFGGGGKPVLAISAVICLQVQGVASGLRTEASWIVKAMTCNMACGCVQTW